MHPFLTELRKGLDRLNVRGQSILVAVSGGADSVALLLGLRELSSEFALSLRIAHLNHRLRGPDCDNDADWVKRLADRLNVPVEIGAVAPESFATSGLGMEETARNLRYRFLDDAARDGGCRSVALAHTADDQSETVLHHLFRGTGIAGLRGIPSVRAISTECQIIRPMLSIRRSVVEDFLRERGQEFRTDQTNFDTSITRNKLRHVVLPMLREEMNPQLDAALSRVAEQAREIEEILVGQAEQLLRDCLKNREPDVCHVDVSGLRDVSPYLVREMFRRLWTLQAWPQQAMSFEHWSRLAGLLRTRNPVTFPAGIDARFSDENLLVLRRSPLPGNATD